MSQLRRRAVDFTVLRRTAQHPRLADTARTPGTRTEALREISSLITTAHDMTGDLLALVRTLGEGAYASLPSSAQTLRSLTAIVHSSSRGATALSAALAAIPTDTASPAPAVRASSGVSAQLAEAARQFEASSTACHVTADSMGADLRAQALATTAPAPTPPRVADSRTSKPKLTAAQRSALRALTSENGRLYERLGGGLFVTCGSGGTQISPATLQALENRDLVRVDHTTPVLSGQKITLTPAGQQALDLQPPAPGTAPASPVTAPVPPRSTPRR